MASPPVSPGVHVNRPRKFSTDAARFSGGPGNPSPLLLIVIVNARAVEQPGVSDAETVNVENPDVVGVPDITPVSGFNERPRGSAPSVTT